MRAIGRLLRIFCRERVGEYVMLCLSEGLIALVLLLHHLDLAIFNVAFGMPLLVFLVFQVIAFIKFVRLHHCLSHVSLDNLSYFPDHSQIGQDYQAIIHDLDKTRQEKFEALANFDKDLLDLTKLWTHQMKVPLAALDLMVQTDRLTVSDVQSQLLELDNYLNILLSYLRLQHTATDFRFETFDVADIMRRIVKKYANQFILKNLSVKIIGSWRITSDQKWLTVALEQIINNAVKYTKTGSVTVTFDTNIVITDTGIGILPEDIPRLFEHGFTGYNGRRNQKSTGLGLYLTKDILSQLNFEIAISSQLDHGTAVTISQSKTTDSVLVR